MTFQVYNKKTKQFAKLSVIDTLYCRFAKVQEDEHHWGRWFHALECPFHLLSREIDSNGNIGQELNLKKGYTFSCVQVAKAMMIQATLWGDNYKEMQNNISYFEPVINFLYAFNDKFEFYVRH